MKIVLDTSVLIAALRSGTGASAEILRMVLNQEVTLLLDYKLVSEYRDVATRPQNLAAFAKTRSEVDEIISVLEAIAEPVLVHTRLRPLSPDPDDDMVVDVAINGHPDALVTHNVADLRVAEEYGIPVWTPQEFLRNRRNP